MALEAQDNPFPYVTLVDTADPSTPAAGTKRLWVDTDDTLKIIDEADVVTSLVGGGIANPLSTDTLWDAAGDLVVGSGANTAAKMAMGTALQTLRVNSGATGLEYAATLGAWTDYTPTWGASVTPPTLGSSTVVGRYKLLDANTGVFSIVATVTTGGAWNAGSGSYNFTLPAGWTSAARLQVVAAEVNDASTRHYTATGRVAASDTKVVEIVMEGGAGSRTVTNAVPVTWATGDTIAIMGIIEIA